MITLEDVGWSDYFASQTFKALEAMETTTARIARHDGETYEVIIEGGESRRARLGGGLRYRAVSRTELPSVGDWVVMQPEEGGLSTILGVYDRRTSFVRQSAGRTTEAQVIAANVDTVFIVTSMNDEFEPRRLERYLLAVRDAGADPVILLNKADLAEAPEQFVAEAEEVARGVPVVSLSALHGTLEQLDDWLAPGRTVVVVGSSGVGKSTLINRLIGAQLQETNDIREDDAKGRHTTTSRQMVSIPGGRGVLIDTPGMREFSLWAGEARAEDVFDDIAELAEFCQFRDCEHGQEPGCAVHQALDDGRLSEERYASWQKLQRELDWQNRRQDVAARRDENRRFSRMLKKVNDDNPKT